MAAAEHAAYLRGLRVSSFATGHPLDLHHQTVLRLALLHGLTTEPVTDLVAGYFARLGRRVELWRDLIGHLPVPAHEARTGTAVMKCSGTSTWYLDRFRSMLAGADGISFANSYGFASFPLTAVRPDGDHRLLPSPAISVGGLDVYGFSDPGTTWFLQELPVSVMAATLAVVGLDRVAELDSDWTLTGTRHELEDDARGAIGIHDLAADLRTACIEFVCLHETGHRLDPARSPRTTAALTRAGVALDDARFTDFPTDDQLASWPRLRAGVPAGPVDVVFLYGDLVANVAALEAGLSPGGYRALRAFNWSLVPGYDPIGRRPRGNMALLVGGHDVIGGCLGLLEDMLSAPPSRWAARLRHEERRAWGTLRARVTLAPRCAA